MSVKVSVIKKKNRPPRRGKIGPRHPKREMASMSPMSDLLAQAAISATEVSKAIQLNAPPAVPHCRWRGKKTSRNQVRSEAPGRGDQSACSARSTRWSQLRLNPLLRAQGIRNLPTTSVFARSWDTTSVRAKPIQCLISSGGCDADESSARKVLFASRQVPSNRG